MMTTSRYSSEATRRFAKDLAKENGERYIARGKKTIDELAVLARKSGEETITIIEERGKKPALASRIRIDEQGCWRWEEERLLNPTEKTG